MYLSLFLLFYGQMGFDIIKSNTISKVKEEKQWKYAHHMSKSLLTI